MDKETKKAVISAVITGVIGFVATIIAASISSNIARKDATQEVINQIENGVANLNGDNANIIINDVDDFISDYEEIKIQNEGLKELNMQFAEQIKKNDEELESLRKQLGDTPAIDYNDLTLCINGKNVPINASNAFVSINGREYISKEFIDNILDENEALTIKDGTGYIGKIIADQSNLFDEWIVDMNGFKTYESVMDSYGNSHLDSLVATEHGSYITYNLNNKYSLLRMSISINNSSANSFIGSITIKADDTIIYNFSELTKMTEPFEITDIPINNCKLLTIESKMQYFEDDIIISDAVVYN